jgi:uncharacterized Zn-binding protein involved in type VI secretion
MTATATTQPLAAPVRNPTSAGTISTPAQRTEIVYPESDGEPIADNTKQFRYIVVIQGGIAALFADNPNVFVAGDLLRYPVEGNNKIWAAPDTMMVFGRPAARQPGAATICGTDAPSTRFSTIRNHFQNYVLDQGRIVEHGHHDALISQDGVYKCLFER